MEKRIHVRDLAPFASSEDLSDERESPLDEEKQKPKLPNIEESMKESPKRTLTVTNVAPRIDISRASSSSHQEDSSPERELLLGSSGKETKLEVAFGEENAADLHSSTEELSFQDPADVEKSKKKKQSQTFTDLQTEAWRKDSGCSDIALLSISGRTSRVSSVGSVASGGSGISNYSAVSHCSARSHLSATSNLSKASRGSSPHRMSLETSFCGPKPVHSASLDVDETAKSIPDKLTQKTEIVVEPILKDSITAAATVGAASTTPAKSKTTPNTPQHRHRQPAAATTSKGRTHTRSKPDSSSKQRRKPPIENPKTQKFVSLHSDEEEEPISARSVNSKPTPAAAAAPTPTPAPPAIDNRMQIFIPLHGDPEEVAMAASKKCEPNPNSPKRMKPFTNTTLVNFISKYDNDSNIRKEKRPSAPNTKAEYQSSAGINEEFQKFISLKDDDDEDGSGRRLRRSASATNAATTSASLSDGGEKPSNQITVPVQVYQAQSPPSENTSSTTMTTPSVSVTPSTQRRANDLPTYLMTDDGTTQYIPLRGFDPVPQNRESNATSNQNNYLSVKRIQTKSVSDDRNLSHLSPFISPNLSRHHKPSNLELNYREHPTRSAKSMTQLINRDESRTPSPNASAISHNRLYRRCSESAKEIRNIEKPKSRSGSIRSLFSSIFKRSGSARNKKGHKSEVPKAEVIESKMTNVEFTFKQQAAKTKEPESIIIPLHSDDELTPSDVKCYTEAKPTANERKANTSCAATENKPNNMDERIEKFVDIAKDSSSSSLSPKTKNVVIHEVKFENREKRKSKDINTAATEASNKGEGERKSNFQPVERVVESFRLECEVTVHKEAITPTSYQQPDVEKTIQAKYEIEFSKERNIDNKEEKEEEVNENKENDIATTAKSNKRTLKHEMDGEEGDISTDSDRVTLMVAENEEENKKLVNPSESFEEELPYVPTTLPLERSVAVPIIPIKERLTEIRTYSVDRPRSVTPLNPALLDNYVATSLPATVASSNEESTTEKLHITLPRTDAAATDVPRKKSPLVKKKTWQNFIEQDLQSPKKVPVERRHSKPTSGISTQESSPPPLPPKKSSSWVSFDESSQEMRQSPKRITTLPASYAVENTAAMVAASAENNETANTGPKIIFVNPDECSCECHETQHGVYSKSFPK